jgi:ribose/xylose/arabinose/galactoside ABC-type transport system permease subunit
MTAVVSPLPLSFGRYRARTVVVALIVVLVLGLLWVFAPNFFKINNLINILVQAATLAVMDAGMSVVMIGGGIDLSLPFNAAVSAVLGAMYMRALRQSREFPPLASSSSVMSSQEFRRESPQSC